MARLEIRKSMLQTRDRVSAPSRVNDMRPYLDRFVAGMLHKLEKNAHKRPPSPEDVFTFVMGMQKEVLEAFEQYVKNPDDENLFYELCDVANFAFLMAMVHMVRKEAKGKADAKRV